MPSMKGGKKIKYQKMGTKPVLAKGHKRGAKRLSGKSSGKRP